MTRTIFLQEFKRSLVQALRLLYPFFIGLVALDKLVLSRPDFQNRISDVFSGTPDAVIDVLISALIVFSGFVFGIGAFYRITDRHIFFIQSLPIPRLQIWTTILLANVSAVLLSMPLMFILRPSLWTRGDVPAIGSQWPYALGAYVVLFGGGCCFVMLFQNVALTASIGALVSLFSITVMFVYANVPLATAQSSRSYGIPLATQSDPGSWLLASVLLALIYLSLSLRFFVTGELRLLNVRVKNWSILSVTLILYPLLLAGVFEADTLRSSDGGDSSELVSADGKYLAVVERSVNNDLLARVTFVDTVTGTLSHPYSIYGVIRFWWSKSQPVFNLATLQSPLRRFGYWLPASDSIVRLSPEGKQIGRITFRFSQILAVAGGSSGPIVVLTQSGNNQKLFAIEDAGKTEWLSFVPKDLTVMHVSPNGEKILATYTAVAPDSGLPAQLAGAWKIDSGVREITWGAAEKERNRAEFLLDNQIYSRKTAVAELKQRFPVESEKALVVISTEFFSNLQRPFQGLEIPFITALNTDTAFAIAKTKDSESDELLIYDPKESNWRTLGNNLTANNGNRPAAQFQLGTISMNPFASLCVDSARGVAVYYTNRNGERDISLYDASAGKSFHLETRPLNDRLDCRGITQFRGVSSNIINEGNRWFFYGADQTIKELASTGGFPINASADGAEVYLKGRQVFYRSPDGQTRRLWPAS